MMAHLHSDVAGNNKSCTTDFRDINRLPDFIDYVFYHKSLTKPDREKSCLCLRVGVIGWRALTLLTYISMRGSDSSPSVSLTLPSPSLPNILPKPQLP